MRVEVTLTLPRDAAHVGAIRKVLASTLSALHAPGNVSEDLQLVLTEACANVIRHAGETELYRVDLSVGEQQCIIEVSDRGPGFQPGSDGIADSLAESGRGLDLIRELTDELQFIRDNGDTQVRLTRSWSKP